MLKSYIENNFKEEIELLNAQSEFNKKLNQHTIIKTIPSLADIEKQGLSYDDYNELIESVELTNDYLQNNKQKVNCDNINNLELLKMLESVYDDIYEPYRLNPDGVDERKDLSFLLANITFAADDFYTMKNRNGDEYIVSPSVVIAVGEKNVVHNALTFQSSHDCWDEYFKENYTVSQFERLNPKKLSFAKSEIISTLNDDQEKNLKSIVNLNNADEFYTIIDIDDVNIDNDRDLFEGFTQKAINAANKGNYLPLTSITKMLTNSTKTPVFKALDNSTLSLIEGDTVKFDADYYAYACQECFKVVDSSMRTLKDTDGKAIQIDKAELKGYLINSEDYDLPEPEPEKPKKKTRSKLRR